MELNPKIVAMISCGITVVFTLATLFFLLLGWIHKNRISEYNSHSAIIFYISIGALGFLTFLKPIRTIFSIVFGSIKTRATSTMTNMSNRFGSATSNINTASTTIKNRATNFGSNVADKFKNFRRRKPMVGGSGDLTEILQASIPPFSNLVGIVSIRDLIVPNNILTIILTIVFVIFLALVGIPYFNNNNSSGQQLNKGLSKIATVLFTCVIIYIILSIFGWISKGFTHLSEGNTLLKVFSSIFKVSTIIFIAALSSIVAYGIVQPEVNIDIIITRLPYNIKIWIQKIIAQEQTTFSV